ncbi:hypothetical protein [Pseudomonas mangiferae]|uniref:hypothetical protein n=1 Tax=Pseudomonas mangiferae TaxID=2593654 RepID=UPI0015B5B88C|nr:hypothetical protein [Pseudomonas mangiferae]
MSEKPTNPYHPQPVPQDKGSVPPGINDPGNEDPGSLVEEIVNPDAGVAPLQRPPKRDA